MPRRVGDGGGEYRSIGEGSDKQIKRKLTAEEKKATKVVKKQLQGERKDSFLRSVVRKFSGSKKSERYQRIGSPEAMRDGAPSQEENVENMVQGALISRTQRAESSTPEGVVPAFNLDAAKVKIADYEMPITIQLSETSRKMLYKGCDTPGSKDVRNRFLEALHERLIDLEKVEKVDGRRPITTLEEFLGDKELVKLYREAVAEESRSVEFRDAVFEASTEIHEQNPCPQQKMVMYIGGPSAAGKSFARSLFVDEVKKKKNPGNDTENAYVVSVDGGVEREMCQMRQMVLQAALSKGYGGIKDLHKNSKMGVKKHVQAAAMKEGNNYHVVIPATFISGLKSLTNLMKKLSGKKGFYQVFGEVGSKDLKTFRETVRYNGESRAFYQKDEDYSESIRMNNRRIPCESKVYQAKYFDDGVRFSKIAKKFFKLVVSKSRRAILSNRSDNIHVVERDGELEQVKGGKDIQPSRIIPHVSQRELRLFEAHQSDNVTPQLINALSSDQEQFSAIAQFLERDSTQNIREFLKNLPSRAKPIIEES